jgi:uncharacterized protein
MKTILTILLVLFIHIAGISQIPADAESVARKFFNHLMAKELGEMNLMLTDEFKAAVPAGQLEQIAEGLEKQLGKFSHVKRAVHSTHEKYEIITLVIQFGQMDFGLNVSMNSQMQVAGFHFVMVPPEKFTSAPSYANADQFIETEIVLELQGISLPGMLSMPVNAQKVPVVILVHGSGAHDMDESMGPNKIFRDIAQGLASKGVAVLRYEKRNYRFAQTLDASTITVWEEAGMDALEAVRLVMQLPGIDPQQVYVAGHSLGGMIAPRIALKEPRLAGIISLAGSPRYLSDIIPQQYEHLSSLNGQSGDNAKKEIQAAWDFSFEMERKRNDPQAVYDNAFMGIPVSYWKDINTNDIGAIAASLPQRILIIQGGRDYQVSMADYEAWKKALRNHPQTTFRLFEDLDHLFFKGDGISRPGDYFNENNVDIRVIEAISDWILNGIK